MAGCPCPAARFDYAHAIGWALLAILSTRRGNGTHRWAAVPAAALGLSAAALIALTPSTRRWTRSDGSGRRFSWAWWSG
jgi:hypothetical protein